MRGEACSGNGSGCHVAGKGQARSIQFEATVVGASSQGFECAPVAASQIEVVMHANAGVVEAELTCVSAQPLATGTHLLALRSQCDIYLWILRRARLCGKKLLRLSQIGADARQRRADMESFVDQSVECG